MIAASEDPLHDPACREMAEETIANWKAPPSYVRTGRGAHTVEMLTLLERLADAELVRRFIPDALVHDYSGAKGKALARLGAKLRWESFAKELAHFVTKQGPDNYSADLRRSETERGMRKVPAEPAENASFIGGQFFV